MNLLPSRKKDLQKKDKINGIIRAGVIEKQYEMYLNALKIAKKNNTLIPFVTTATYLKENLERKTTRNIKNHSPNFTPYKPKKEFIKDFGFQVFYNKFDYKNRNQTLHASSIRTDKSMFIEFIQRLQSVPIQTLRTTEYMIRLHVGDSQNVKDQHACVFVLNLGTGKAFVYDPANVDGSHREQFEQQAKHRHQMFETTANLIVKTLRYYLPQLKTHQNLNYSSLFGGQMYLNFCLIHTTNFIKIYLSKRESIMNRNKLFYQKYNWGKQGNHNFKYNDVEIGNSFKKNLPNFDKTKNNIKKHWIYTTMCYKYGSTQNRMDRSQQLFHQQIK